MENNDKQTNNPSAGGEKKAHHNDRNRNRHGRGGRHHRPAGNDAAKQNTGTMDKSFFAAQEPSVKGDASRQNQGQKKNKSQSHQKQNDRAGNPQKKDNQGNKKGRQHSRNHSRRPNEQRPYDPYEEVALEELSLEELRARIVLKPETGSMTDLQSDESLETPLPSEPAKELSEAEIPLAEVEVKRVEVVGVRFRSAGKTYYFDPHGIKAKKGEFVIVETARGAEFGEVSLANTMIAESEVVSPLRPICRIATREDIAHDAENRQKEKDALRVCQQKVEAHKLDMKLIDVQYAFDNSKLLFYFSAEGRVDFRELVKDLASTFRTRIELRQIGIRDEAKLLGGLGACGRPLCCSTFLPDFAQVSIKMAKDQSLSLNSSKISGLCGRLMCCLRYEQEVYVDEIRKTPSNDTLVKTEDGLGTVIGSNPLAGTVRVLLKDSPDTPPKQYHRDNVTVIGKNKRENRSGDAKKEAKESE